MYHPLRYLSVFYTQFGDGDGDGDGDMDSCGPIRQDPRGDEDLENPVRTSLEDEAWFQVEPAIETSTLPSFRLVESGTGRVVERRLESAAISVFEDYFDHELNVSCSLQRASDGTTRCLPGSASWNYFSDPACTQRVAHALDGDLPAFVKIAPNECKTDCLYEVYRVSSTRVHTAYRLHESPEQTKCILHTFTTPKEHVAPLGERLPPTAFVALPK